VINISRGELQNHFIKDLHVRFNDVVFLFSSIKGLGMVQNGFQTVLEVLEDILVEGTLILPTFTYSWSNQERFNSLITPAPLMGNIANLSIGRAGYHRTSHPNFSVNILSNTNVHESISNSKTADAFGVGSIFHNIYVSLPQTKIILLGGAFNDCIYRSTFIHTAQQLEGAWYRYLKGFKDPEGHLPNVTQYVRYRSQEEYIQINGELPKKPHLFPILENFGEYGRDLKTAELIKIVNFGYSQTKLVTVKDTVETFRLGLRRNPDYGLSE
jgi:aminoglycoside N3'-acetyltransferase